MEITLRQIKYFVAVSETGKLSAAASLVNISPSSITEAIKELESITGVTLINRHRRGVDLTFEGFRFLQHCHDILSSVSNAEYDLKNSKTKLSGKLTIGVTFTIAGYFLASHLSRFNRSFPHIETRIIESSRVNIEEQILRGEIDIAILLVSNTENGQLKTKLLVSSPRKLWMSMNHPLTQKKQISLQDVSQFPYIQLLVDETESTHMRYWQRNNAKPQVYFRTESVEAVRSLVAVGTGVTILSDMVYRPWSLEGKRIEACELVEQIPSMDVGLAWLKKVPPGPCATAFIDFCLMEYTSGRPKYSQRPPAKPEVCIVNRSNQP